MKKLSFTITLCLVAALSFGQKKAVNAAKNETKSDKPNIAEARTLIKGALEDPETKNDAETWFVAGSVENKQFDLEKTKELLGQKPDEKVMYEALGAIIPYYLKADELDQLPNEKGKVKPKFRKDIKSIIAANRVYYINGGAYYFDQKDYKMAYDYFNQYLNIPELPIFQGDKDFKFEKDSTYLQIQYYAAISATQMNDHPKAIEAYKALIGKNYKEQEVYQYLCYEYEQTKDTVNIMATLKEGVSKFPEDTNSLMNLINYCIYANQNDEALGYLTTAINRKPNDAQLYDVLGRIYENKKDITKAAECFEKALSIDPNYAEALGSMGRIYFNQAVEAQAAANEITDNKKYKEAADKAKELFRKGMPYLEKAHELKPDEKEYLVGLHGTYYNLALGDKFKEVDAKLNGTNQ